MSVDAHISCSTRQTLVLSVLNVSTTLSINKLFGQSKINDVHNFFILSIVATKEKIFWFDVSVY